MYIWTDRHGYVLHVYMCGAHSDNSQQASWDKCQDIHYFCEFLHKPPYLVKFTICAETHPNGIKGCNRWNCKIQQDVSKQRGNSNKDRFSLLRDTSLEPVLPFVLLLVFLAGFPKLSLIMCYCFLVPCFWGLHQRLQGNFTKFRLHGPEQRRQQVTKTVKEYSHCLSRMNFNCNMWSNSVQPTWNF